MTKGDDLLVSAGKICIDKVQHKLHSNAVRWGAVAEPLLPPPLRTFADVFPPIPDESASADIGMAKHQDVFRGIF